MNSILQTTGDLDIFSGTVTRYVKYLPYIEDQLTIPVQYIDNQSSGLFIVTGNELSQKINSNVDVRDETL